MAMEKHYYDAHLNREQISINYDPINHTVNNNASTFHPVGRSRPVARRLATSSPRSSPYLSRKDRDRRQSRLTHTMPGRTAASSAASTVKSKKSGSAGAGRRTSSATPQVDVPDEPPLPTTSSHLRADVCAIFADSQRSTTGHRKLAVRLRKLQESCCGIVIPKQPVKKDGDSEDVQMTTIPSVPSREETLGEQELNVEINRCLLRILTIKKTEPVGDRVLRFLGLFLSHAAEKDTEIFTPAGSDETQIFPETPTTRLTFSIVSTMVPILGAKDRTVRYRATQIISHIVIVLDSIDDELYRLVRQGLLKRIRDKETTIRVQAVSGLARLIGNEGEEEDVADGTSSALLEKLVDILQNDSAAEVRRTLLLNLPLTPTTLPYLLERARDLDAATRRALYSRLLPSLGDFRHLSLGMREKLLRWGLRDRDESVQKATGKLFYERWIEDCAGNKSEEGGPVKELSSPNMPALLELLERIDVVSSGMESGVAHEAMKCFWEGRPDYRNELEFDQAFWEDLTAESAFLARSFNEFCRVDHIGTYDNLVDEKMPEVTALAYYLAKYSAALLEKLKQSNEPSTELNEEVTMENEFIVEQLLYIALTLDYSDEVGRRKMFTLLRENLAVPELPDECTKLTVEVLRCVCGPETAGESEFCGVVLEAVAEVHDAIVTEESFVSARSELSDDGSSPIKSRRSETPGEEDESFDKEGAKAKVLREIMINMKCLHIAQFMLQNVEGPLQQNMHLVTMLNNLVVPAVRSHEAPIRERGLECLGLCCLLDKTLAEENMTLFLHCYSKGHEGLQEKALHIVADLLTMHQSLLMPVVQPDTETVTPPAFQKPLLKVLSKALKSNSHPGVQTAAAAALSKLLLTNTFSPSGPSVPPAIQEINESSIETLLQSLVVSFFHPRTRENPGLRQALAYFFPVYCHSRIVNTQRMRRIGVPVIRAVLNATEEHFSLEAEEDSDGDVDETLSEREIKNLMTGVIGMLVEWTDERRVIGMTSENVLSGGVANPNAQGWVHLALIKDILERVLGISTGPNKCSKDERKLLMSLLSKLYIATPSPLVSTSRSGSRVPDSEDAFRSSGRSIREEIEPTQLQLTEEVKELLDQAIEDGVAPDATGRNAIVKIKNTVLKIIALARESAAGSRTSVRDRAGTEETEITTVDSGASREPSIIPGHNVQVSVEDTIMEEGEAEEQEVDVMDTSKETVIKAENYDIDD